MTTAIDDLVQKLDEKCERLIAMVFVESSVSTEDPRIDEFADDRGIGTDTINLCIDSGMLKQVGSADDGENFQLVSGWWPHSLPPKWRDFILGAARKARAIEALQADADRRVAEEREACANIAEATRFDATDTDWDIGVNDAKRVIASAIRSRSNDAPAPSLIASGDDWVMMPRVPTVEMFGVAGAEVLNKYVGAKPEDSMHGTADWAFECYAAMLSAAPSPPVNDMTAPATGRSPISQELQDARIADLEKEVERLREDNKWLRRDR